MNDPIKTFLEILKTKSALDCKQVSQAVDQLLVAPSVEQILQRLITLSPEVDDNTLGYFIFPGLKRKLIEKKTALRREVKKIISRQDIPVNFRLHCIELIEKLMRESKVKYSKDDVNFICETAVNPAIADTVRARMAKILPKFKGKKQLEVLRVLVSSNEAKLVEAACHTLSRWPKEKLARHDDLINDIANFAQSSTAAAIKCPNILRTLSTSRKPVTEKALDTLVEKADSLDDWARLAVCIGPDSPIDRLAKIIRNVTQKKGLQATIAIQNLLKKKPDKLDSLYKEKYYDEYVRCLMAHPDIIGKSAFKTLQGIEQQAKPEVSKKTAGLIKELNTSLRNALLPKAIVKERKKKSGNQEIPSSNKHSINNEYSTNLHMGDAIYRDTFLVDPFTHNHWHTGIFQSFEFDENGNGTMQGIHMTGFPGDVQAFKAELSFKDPNDNVAYNMETLFNNFLDEFFLNKGRNSYKYHGPRRTSVMSKDDRIKLNETAGELLNHDMDYCWWDMLVQKGDNWDGSVQDIKLIRCDGVVEYVYEKCGKKVCAGKYVSKFNIAYPDNDCLESHEDLHTFGLNPGELCPRVQAGDEGDDTTFIKPGESLPIIIDYDVYEKQTQQGNVIAIKLSVDSNEYHHVYIRLTVGHEGRPFYFLKTGVTGYPEGIEGIWMFKKVDEGTQHIAYWLGETNDIDFYGINGTYEFRAVAVDKGGNVSEEFSFSLPIDWSRMRPRS